jgi:hypothetical protein
VLAEEPSVPVIIHPAVDHIEGEFIRCKNIPTYSGYLSDQGTALLNLVMAGTFEKYPKLTIIATHLGGSILMIFGCFKALSNRFPTDLWYTDLEGNRKLFPHPIDCYLKKINYGCNNAEVPDNIHAVSMVRTEHLLRGSYFLGRMTRSFEAVGTREQEPDRA